MYFYSLGETTSQLILFLFEIWIELASLKWAHSEICVVFLLLQWIFFGSVFLDLFVHIFQAQFAETQRDTFAERTKAIDVQFIEQRKYY